MSTNTLEKNMRATAEALVKGFEGTWTLEPVMAPRAPECRHTMLPTSLGLKPKTNDEWAARFKRLEGLVYNAKMSIDDYLAVPAERRAVVRTTMDAQTKVGPYHNEYIWFFSFNEDGGKITAITEFFDTRAGQGMLGKLKEAGLFEEDAH